MKRFLYGLILLLFIGSAGVLFVKLTDKVSAPKEPLQFFSQDQYIDDKEPHRSYVVIVSPPETNEELRQAVDSYIDENYNFNEIDRLGGYVIYFYKESKVTKRVYQERPEYTDYLNYVSSYVPIIDHDDMLLMIIWEKVGSVYKAAYFFENTVDTCPIYLAVYENGVEKKMYSDEHPCEDPNNPGTYFPDGWITTKKSGARFVPSVK